MEHGRETNVPSADANEMLATLCVAVAGRRARRFLVVERRVAPLADPDRE
jgi:hypothetical protein